jgi:hypothetical protein
LLRILALLSLPIVRLIFFRVGRGERQTAQSSTLPLYADLVNLLQIWQALKGLGWFIFSSRGFLVQKIIHGHPLSLRSLPTRFTTVPDIRREAMRSDMRVEISFRFRLLVKAVGRQLR